MQVATLFRETSALLGGSNDTSEGSVSKFNEYQQPQHQFQMQSQHHQELNHHSYNNLLPPHHVLSQDSSPLYKESSSLLPHEMSSKFLTQNMYMPHSPMYPPPMNCMKCEEPPPPHPSHPHPHMLYMPHHNMQYSNIPIVPRKRGRKKKEKVIENESNGGLNSYEEESPTLPAPSTDQQFLVKSFKERKKHDRFNGMPEEEVSKRTLPDHLSCNLDIVIIGINPGLFAAFNGHHYAGPGNHFWKCLYLSGIIQEPMTAEDDYKLLQCGIGFTNMVERATKGSADLTRKEIKKGSQILLEKLQKFKPKIAVFNGKLIYEVFSGKKDFNFGRQPGLVDGTNTYMWVMPSSSARCAQLPRASDKVPFYSALKKFRDYLNGLLPEIDESDIVFCNSKLKNYKEDSRDDLDGDLSLILKKEDDEEPSLKKKRGRPKKNKLLDGEEVKREPKEKLPTLFDDDPSKKKRGRPKKIKGENNAPVGFNNSDLDIKPEKSNSSEISSLPSIYNMVGNQMRCNSFVSSPVSCPVSYNRSDTISPGDSRSHSTDHLSHSDVKENTPLYESNTFTEEPSTSPKTEYPPSTMKEEPNAQNNECCFPSASVKDETPPQGFLEYDSFSMDPDKSLVDQIPNITETDISPLSTVVTEQYSEDSAYLSDYPRTYSVQSLAVSEYQGGNCYSNPLANDYNTNHSSSQSPTNLNLQEKSLMPTYHDTSSYPNVMRPTPSHPYLVNSYNNFRIGTHAHSGEPDNSPSYSYPSAYPNPHPTPGYNFHLTGPNFLYSPYPNNSYMQHPTSTGFMPDVFKSDM
ncbi:hypothetical protein M8J76_017071 [Diaphorina citri]|nr:hypothetical protein M8J76_017071 [Diaphorina citri]